MTLSCALCNTSVAGHAITEGAHTFCCIGCHAVFGILAAQNQLHLFEQHPIFLQAVQCGLISNPDLLEQIQKQKQQVKEEERQKCYFEIGGMWCPSCAEIIRLILLQRQGIVNATIDYATDLASIEYSPRYFSKEQIFGVIAGLGYCPKEWDDGKHNPVSKDLNLRFGVAAFFALNAMMFAYPLYATYFHYDGEGYGNLFAWASFFSTLPVVFYSAAPIWKRFVLSLSTGFYGMEALIAIGVWSAFGLSLHELLTGGNQCYFDSMSVIIVFALLGKIIENKAKFSAKESLIRLARSAPRKARKRFEDGNVLFVPVKEVSKGDILVALTGEKLALDGVVMTGKAAVDESLMTGEAVPVNKQVRDFLLGGTLIVQGSVEYRVANGPDETALHKIIEMVEKDIGNKTVYVRAADAIVQWFVPCVIAIAAFTAVCYWFFPGPNDLHPIATGIMRALSVLLISCPCAIGIAAPAAESYLLYGLSSLGVIVRNRGSLRFLGKEDVIVFDKTGTVTEGKFHVKSGIGNLTAKEKAALFLLTRHSIHPISVAIAHALESTCIQQDQSVHQIEEVIGYGVKGVIDGIDYSLGSDLLMKQQEICLPLDGGQKAACTLVYFAGSGKVITTLHLMDRVRPEVVGVVQALKPARTVLLSGDSEDNVSTVAKACGFDAWQSRSHPLEKREYIEREKKKGNIVCMLGDGMNDAAALTASHLGISVVSAADMSVQVSDLLLTLESLEVIPRIRALAIKGKKIVRQNLFWAFFYNIFGILLAAFGVLSPIFAAFAMSISSVIVLFNARRLLLIQHKGTKTRRL